MISRFIEVIYHTAVLMRTIHLRMRQHPGLQLAA